MSSTYFNLATESDNEELLRFLHNNPMPGRVSVALERNPNFFFGAGIEGETHQTLVARTTDQNRIMAVGSRSVRMMWVDGQQRSIGYLGQLRIDHEFRSRGKFIIHGYQHMHELHDNMQKTESRADFYISTIVSDNKTAMRILGNNVKGMPKYRRYGELSSFLLPIGPRLSSCSTTGRVNIRQAVQADLTSILECLQRNNQRFQFAPVWTRENFSNPVRTHGLRVEDFILAEKAPGEICGVMALWDQTAFKQTVICGYSNVMDGMAKISRKLGELFHTPSLPKVGGAIPFAFVSHVAVDQDNQEVFLQLLSRMRQIARLREISFLTLGFADKHPFNLAIRNLLLKVEYRSTIFTVCWEDGAQAVAGIDSQRIPHLELAIL
ncbi:MAG: hypothetical protein A2X86_17155 [Bdellovibrionales bacterium GWA2_49_15]|nr:MAG: hypothetical protein A2X86_17155 [Bdellovibrionales bacterium GWA2_49_15]HAZ14033.1 hypothetical protein [Bdellovibrionales bacterium]